MSPAIVQGDFCRYTQAVRQFAIRTRGRIKSPAAPSSKHIRVVGDCGLLPYTHAMDQRDQGRSRCRDSVAAASCHNSVVAEGQESRTCAERKYLRRLPHYKLLAGNFYHIETFPAIVCVVTTACIAEGQEPRSHSVYRQLRRLSHDTHNWKPVVTESITVRFMGTCFSCHNGVNSRRQSHRWTRFPRATIVRTLS